MKIETMRFSWLLQSVSYILTSLLNPHLPCSEAAACYFCFPYLHLTREMLLPQPRSPNAFLDKFMIWSLV